LNPILSYRHVVFLTGAGISVASGIRPYRGPDGLWNDETLVRLSDIETFHAEPLAVWLHWWKLRGLAMAAQPNPAHLTLVRLEALFADRAGCTFTVITQNVDGLHGRAGSHNLVEYHGSGLRTRCSNRNCDLPAYVDESCAGSTVPLCPRCGSYLRPDIVLFGESIPLQSRVAAERSLQACDLFLAVGTSATVYPAAMFVDVAKARGARTVYINLQPIDVLGGCGSFDESWLGPAEDLLPALFLPPA
jgi:NAD-dependent deacetylase